MARAERSPGLDRAVDLAYAALVVVLIVAMAASVGFETVPYHVIFVVFTVVYGFRIWSVRITAIVLGLISAATGAVFLWHYAEGKLPADELTEIVLMPMILVAMVWHARRREAAQRRVEELVAAERARREREREFLRDASHALRTPLTVARGNLELLAETDPVLDESPTMDIVLGEMDRMDRLAARLLVIAGLERPDGLSRAELDPAELAHTVFARWSGSLDRDWRIDAEDGAVIVGEAERIEEALDAMVENAVRATETGAVVRVVCRWRGDRVLLGVADAGVGLQPGDSQRIFQRFWRNDRGSERPGSGLGLALVKAVADAHDGAVLATHSEEGGALIGMLLPCRSAGRAVTGSPRDAAPISL
jgi:signal transduction histidine kinase